MKRLIIKIQNVLIEMNIRNELAYEKRIKLLRFECETCGAKQYQNCISLSGVIRYVPFHQFRFNKLWLANINGQIRNIKQ